MVEASGTSHLKNDNSNPTMVPTLATISEVYPVTLQKDDLKYSPRICIKNSSQASTIVLYFLSVLCSPSANEFTEDKKEHVVLTDYAWMLSCLTRIWNVIAPEWLRSLTSEVSSYSLVTFLDTVRIASSRLAAIKYESSTASRTLVLLAQAIATLLLDKPAQSPSMLDKSICLGLFELASSSKRAPPSLRTFNEHVLPTLLEIIDDDDRFDSFDGDLQVRLDLTNWTA